MAAYRTETIASVADLLDCIQSARTTGWSPSWFRGQHDAAWSLRPKVQRNAAKTATRPEADYTYETNLTQRFRARAPLLGAPIDFPNVAAWLQVMQHHFLPTRLLDWSRSPLVAAYFALEKTVQDPHQADVDAVIWHLNPHLLNWLATDGYSHLTPSIESGDARALVMGAFIGDDRARLDPPPAWAGADDPAKVRTHPDHLAVMSSEADIRMVVQQGAFTVHGFSSTPLDLDGSLAQALQKLVIPADKRASFAREIVTAGYEEAGIYPYLDYLGKELERTQADVGR